MFARVLSVLALTSLMTACAGVPVVTDFDPEKDITGFKHYEWIADDKIVRHLMVDTALVDKRVRNAVEDNLAIAGYEKAANGEDAQFVVAYHYDVKDKLYIDSYHTYGGYYPWWHHSRFGHHHGAAFSDINVRQYEQGILIIDLIDKADNKLFWRGIAERRLKKGLTPQQRDDEIRTIVDGILARFPS